jgi:hypothetical protein
MNSIKKRAIIIFIITEMIFILSSFVLVKRGVLLLGDEPHYLAIAHSIAKDGDINVFNQYARDEYKYFIDYKLSSHAKEGKGFKKWYSIHLPGLSFTLAPFLFFQLPFPLLYFLLRSFMGLFGAGLSVLIYLFLTRLVDSKKLPVFITAVFTFTAPIFFMSIHIFAEIQASFLIVLSLYLIICVNHKSPSKVRLVLSGLFMGLSIFWGLKYLLFVALYGLGYAIYSVKKDSIKNVFYVAVFPVLFVIIFIFFLYYAYGTISPTAVYTGVITVHQKAELIQNTKMIPLSLKLETLFDYFFDQRDGLILYNPFYLFFFPGMILAFKNFKKYFTYILISIPVFVYILYHGYSTIRAGYCPQARYLTPVVWLFIVFALIYYLEAKNKLFKKVFILIPVYSLFLTVYQLFNPFTLYQQTTHDCHIRAGLLFQNQSNLYFNISNYLPSFAKVNGNFKYIPNVVFFVFLILFIIFSIRKSKNNNLQTLNILYIFVFSVFFIIVSLFPKFPLNNYVKVKNMNKKNTVPFMLYVNEQSNRSHSHIYDSWRGEIRGNGIRKLYVSIPNIYYNKYLKNKKNTILTSVVIEQEHKNFKLNMYNFNNKVFSSAIKSYTKAEIKLDDTKYKILKNRVIIVFTMFISNNQNKKPVKFTLDLNLCRQKL